MGTKGAELHLEKIERAMERLMNDGKGEYARYEINLDIGLDKLDLLATLEIARNSVRADIAARSEKQT